MKKFLLVATLLSATSALLSAPFEGKVQFKISAERGKTQEIGYLLKAGKMRIEVTGMKEGGGIIIDLASKQTIAIMDEQKMYMVMPMPDVAAQAAATKPGETTFEATGEKTKILGYDAEKYLSTHQGLKTEMWLAEGLGTFIAPGNANPMGGGKSGGSAGQAWERALAGKELFPLRVISFDKSGKQSFSMEATAIDRKALPDSLFAPPEGYQKFDMGGMMQGLMPGGVPRTRR